MAIVVFLAAVVVRGKQNNEKCYSMMYRGFTWIKYGSLGGNTMRKTNDCVDTLIYQTFPVEVGKMKRGFVASKEAGNRDE